MPPEIVRWRQHAQSISTIKLKGMSFIDLIKKTICKNAVPGINRALLASLPWLKQLALFERQSTCLLGECPLARHPSWDTPLVEICIANVSIRVDGWGDCRPRCHCTATECPLPHARHGISWEEGSAQRASLQVHCALLLTRLSYFTA